VIGQELMVLNWKRVNSDYIQGRIFSLWWGRWNTGAGCPESWQMPHPWQHSRSGWTGLWATWSSWRCPCLLQGGWARWHFQPKLFYDYL